MKTTERENSGPRFRILVRDGSWAGKKQSTWKTTVEQVSLKLKVVDWAGDRKGDYVCYGCREWIESEEWFKI